MTRLTFRIHFPQWLSFTLRRYVASHSLLSTRSVARLDQRLSESLPTVWSGHTDSLFQYLNLVQSTGPRPHKGTCETELTH